MFATCAALGRLSGSSFTFPFHCDTTDTREAKIGEIKQHLHLPPRIRNNNSNSHGVDSDFCTFVALET